METKLSESATLLVVIFMQTDFSDHCLNYIIGHRPSNRTFECWIRYKRGMNPPEMCQQNAGVFVLTSCTISVCSFICISICLPCLNILQFPKLEYRKKIQILFLTKTYWFLLKDLPVTYISIWVDNTQNNLQHRQRHKNNCLLTFYCLPQLSLEIGLQQSSVCVL